MIRLKFEQDPDFRKQFTISNVQTLKELTKGATELLRGKLDVHNTSGHGKGAGGRPPSIFGEYPQKQTGRLLASLDFQRVDMYAYGVGFFNRGKPAIGIELNEPDDGGRAPLHMLFERDFEETTAYMKKWFDGSR
jgi:hypothetical protein